MLDQALRILNFLPVLDQNNCFCPMVCIEWAQELQDIYRKEEKIKNQVLIVDRNQDLYQLVLEVNLNF